MERHILEMILEFFNIIDWRLEDYFFELKFDDLSNWFETYKPHMKQVESTAKFMGINHLLKYFKLQEDTNRGNLIL